jgi:hypothetical protein
VDDGLQFLGVAVATSVTRDDDINTAVRLRLHVLFASAGLRLLVDITVGDPVVPERDLPRSRPSCRELASRCLRTRDRWCSPGNS